MTTPTFTWSPRVDPTGTAKLRVRRAQFGDGYEQRAADGINNKSQSWPLSFVGGSAYIQPIANFLDSQAGYQSFYWTPPLGSQGFYRCETYSVRRLEGDNYELACTFEQSFQP